MWKKVIDRGSERIINVCLIFPIVWVSFLDYILYYTFRSNIYFNLSFFLVLLISLFKIRSYRSVISGKTNFLFWLYVLGISFGVLFAKNYRLAFPQGVYFIYFSICYFFIFRINFRTDRCIGLVRVFVSCATLVAIIGFLEFIYSKNIIYEYVLTTSYYLRFCGPAYKRAMSTLTHPAVLGTYSVACLPLCYFLISTAQKKWKKICFSIFAFLIFCVLVLTISRGSLTAFSVMCVVYFYKKRKYKTIFLFLGIVAFIIIFCSFPHKISSLQRFGIKALMNKSYYFYKWSRVITTLKILRDHPFVGLGIDNFRLFFNTYYPHTNNVEWLQKIPDCMFLMILGETGLLGFLTFFVFMFYLIRKAFFLFDHYIKDKIDRELILSLSCALIAVLVNMLTYDMLYWITPLFIFWFLVGLISGLERKYLDYA